MEGVELRPWQESLLSELVDDPHPREIIWYYDNIGNTGKSFMATFMLKNHQALVVSSGKTADIAHVYDGHSIVIWDLSRSNMESINYGAMEDIKNGRIFSLSTIRA